MVTIMPSNPWRCADFLERVRPGIAVSVALHAGLFVLLAYLLAFHSPMPVPPVPEGPVLTVVPPPVVPLKPIDVEIPKVPKFKPIESKPIKGVVIDVPPLGLPPVKDSEPPQTQTTTGPVQAVIVNPIPIYRGGLIYPERAADQGREGYVDFDFIIEPDGTVGNPVVVAEVPDGIGFAAAAKKAFPKWRFAPMTKDGHPIAAPAHIRVTFKLN